MEHYYTLKNMDLFFLVYILDQLGIIIILITELSVSFNRSTSIQYNIYLCYVYKFIEN